MTNENDIYDGKLEFLELLKSEGYTDEIHNSSGKLWAAYCLSKKNIDIDVSFWAINLYVDKYKYLKDARIQKQERCYYKYEIIDKNGIVYRGDTMTSFSNFIRQYFKIKDKLGNIGEECCAERILGGQSLNEQIERFSKLAYCAGNLIPVPLRFNSERSGCYADCDYWDIVMYSVYKWCCSGNDRYIIDLLNRYNQNKHVSESLFRFKKWMENFHNNWFEFVEFNHLKAFVDVQSQYWYPKEFWKNHFAFNRKINELSEEEFYAAVKLICDIIVDRYNELDGCLN